MKPRRALGTAALVGILLPVAGCGSQVGGLAVEPSPVAVCEAPLTGCTSRPLAAAIAQVARLEPDATPVRGTVWARHYCFLQTGAATYAVELVLGDGRTRVFEATCDVGVERKCYATPR